MEIVRYDLTGDMETGRVDITPVPESLEGRFVSYEDYASLQEHINKLTDRLNRSEDYSISIDMERMELHEKVQKLAADCLSSDLQADVMQEQVNALKDKNMRMAAESVAMKSDELVEFLRLVECMNSDHCEGNYGHSHEWIRHIVARQHEYEEKFGDTPWGIASGSKYLATDSVIREIGAKAVEIFGDELGMGSSNLSLLMKKCAYDHADKLRAGDKL